LVKSKCKAMGISCINNLKQLQLGFIMYPMDYGEFLLACQTGLPNGRTNWITGTLDFRTPADPSNWNVDQDISKGPMWSYTGKNASIYKCPADISTVAYNGLKKPRVRSNSMSQVFGFGEWLDATYNRAQTRWRTYDKMASIMSPARTFVFVDEHPDSLNDSAFATACTRNQPTDPPNGAWLIDFPSNWHCGACGFSFSDGHAEIHKWTGSKIRNAPITFTSTLPLNVAAGDSWKDAHWMADVTTVKR